MNSETIWAHLRTILQFVAGYLVARGVGSDELWAAVIPGVVALASYLYSAYWISKKST